MNEKSYIITLNDGPFSAMFRAELKQIDSERTYFKLTLRSKDVKGKRIRSYGDLSKVFDLIGNAIHYGVQHHDERTFDKKAPKYLAPLHEIFYQDNSTGSFTKDLIERGYYYVGKVDKFDYIMAQSLGSDMWIKNKYTIQDASTPDPIQNTGGDDPKPSENYRNTNSSLFISRNPSELYHYTHSGLSTSDAIKKYVRDVYGVDARVNFVKDVVKGAYYVEGSHNENLPPNDLRFGALLVVEVPEDWSASTAIRELNDQANIDRLRDDIVQIKELAIRQGHGQNQADKSNDDPKTEWLLNNVRIAPNYPSPIKGNPTLFPDKRYRKVVYDYNNSPKPIRVDLPDGEWLEFRPILTVFEERPKVSSPASAWTYQFHDISNLTSSYASASSNRAWPFINTAAWVVERFLEENHHLPVNAAGGPPGVFQLENYFRALEKYIDDSLNTTSTTDPIYSTPKPFYDTGGDDSAFRDYIDYDYWANNAPSEAINIPPRDEQRYNFQPNRKPSNRDPRLVDLISEFARWDGNTIPAGSIRRMREDLQAVLSDLQKNEYYRTLGKEVLRKVMKIKGVSRGEPVLVTFTRATQYKMDAFLNECTGQATGSRDLCAAVFLPVSDIKTDPDRFQNRQDAFSVASAEAVAERYDPNKFDPIVVWEDESDGNIYVLSGHSRFEGMLRRGATHVAARFFVGDEAAAIKFARVDANRTGDPETLFADIKAFRLMRDGDPDRGIPKATQKELQQRFPNVWKRLDAYTYLNPKGRFMAQLLAAERYDKNEDRGNERVDDALEDVSAGQDEWYGKFVQRKATWVGNLRKRYRQLTDRHEEELFDYLMIDREGAAKDRAEIEHMVDQIVGANMFFDPETPLSLKRPIRTGIEARADTGPAVQMMRELTAEINRFKAQLQVAQTEQERDLLRRYINENNNRILQIQQDINQVTRTQSSLFGVRRVLGDPTGQGGIDPETKRVLIEAALAFGKEKLQGWAADQQRQIDSQRDNPDTISDLGLSADDEKAATAIVGTLAGAAFTAACIGSSAGIGTPACLALGGVVSGVASALMGKLFSAFRRGAPTQAMTWAGWITSGRWNAPGNNAKFRVNYIAEQIGLVTLQEVFEIVLWQPMFNRPGATLFPWIAERHTAFRWTSTPLGEALPSGAPKPYAFEHIDQDNRIKEDYAYALMNWRADQADEWQNFVAQCRRLAGQLFAPDPDPVDARQCLFQARPVVYDRSLRKAGFGPPFAPGPAKRFTDSSAWNGYTNILRRNRMGFTWLAMLWMEQCMGSDRVPTRADLENFSTRFNEAQSWALRQLADPNSEFWNTGDTNPPMLRESSFPWLTTMPTLLVAAVGAMIQSR